MPNRTQAKVSFTAMVLHFALLANGLALCVENVVAPPAESAFPDIHRALQLSFTLLATLAWVELALARLGAHYTWFSLRPAHLGQFMLRLWDGIVIRVRERPVVLPMVMSTSLIVATTAAILSVPDFITFDLIFQPRAWVAWSVNAYHFAIGSLAFVAIAELIAGLLLLCGSLHLDPPAGGHHV